MAVPVHRDGDGRALNRARGLQRRRRALQAGFFLLFLLAPALNLLRFDLVDTQLWLLGQRVTLGIGAFQRGEATATQTALAILTRGFAPVLLLLGGFLYVAWRWGRLYCGWLCPHFSAVELLNDLLHRACGRLSLWDPPPPADTGQAPQRRWWPLFALSCALLGFLWATTLLTYLLPPQRIWTGLWQGTLTANQARFIGIGSLLFTLEFAFARHLFCRFGCAVGLFQSLLWMSNARGLVMAFDRGRARDCRDCRTAAAPTGAACDQVCPMRLRPRNIKRLMFSCVQCGRCADACHESQTAHGRPPLLEWTVGVEALRETRRHRPGSGTD
jgi:ferredoxin-type protein NapH